MYGPPVPVSPDEVGQIVLMVDNRDSAGRPSGKVESLGGEEFRRSVYVQMRRSMPLGVLEPFDLPAMTPNCEQRPSSTGPSQSLLMMNNPFVVQTSQALAERIRSAVGADPSAQAKQAWRLVFGVEPDEQDLSEAVAFLQPVSPEAAESAVTGDGSRTADPATAASQQTDQRLAHFCHALISSYRFLYVE